MQTASSRIWTRVTVPIAYDDNRNTMSASIYEYVYMRMCLCLMSVIHGSAWKIVDNELKNKTKMKNKKNIKVAKRKYMKD